MRAEPPAQQLGAGPGVEDERARRVERTGQDELPVAPPGQGQRASSPVAPSVPRCSSSSNPSRRSKLSDPELAVADEPAHGRLGNGSRHQPARAPLGIAAGADQPGVLQHLEVLGDGRLAHRRTAGPARARWSRPARGGPGWPAGSGRPARRRWRRAGLGPATAVSITSRFHNHPQNINSVVRHGQGRFNASGGRHVRPFQVRGRAAVGQAGLMARPRIVIVGAGFAGFHAARELCRSGPRPGRHRGRQPDRLLPVPAAAARGRGRSAGPPGHHRVAAARRCPMYSWCWPRPPRWTSPPGRCTTSTPRVCPARSATTGSSSRWAA